MGETTGGDCIDVQVLKNDVDVKKKKWRKSGGIVDINLLTPIC